MGCSHSKVYNSAEQPAKLGQPTQPLSSLNLDPNSLYELDKGQHREVDSVPNFPSDSNLNLVSNTTPQLSRECMHTARESLTMTRRKVSIHCRALPQPVQREDIGLLPRKQMVINGHDTVNNTPKNMSINTAAISPTVEPSFTHGAIGAQQNYLSLDSSKYENVLEPTIKQKKKSLELYLNIPASHKNTLSQESLVQVFRPIPRKSRAKISAEKLNERGRGPQPQSGHMTTPQDNATSESPSPYVCEDLIAVFEFAKDLQSRHSRVC